MLNIQECIERITEFLISPLPQGIEECENAIQQLTTLGNECSKAVDLQRALDENSPAIAQIKRLWPQVQEKNRQILQNLEEAKKAYGKKLLKELPATASAEEYGRALFLAEYGFESPLKVLEYIKNRDVEKLLDQIGHNSLNKVSEKIFSRATGVELGKTQKARVAQILSWAGLTEEEYNRKKQMQKEEEEQKYKLEHRYDEITSLWSRLGNEQVNSAKGIITLQRWILDTVEQYPEAKADTTGNGAVKRYAINLDGETIRSLSQRRNCAKTHLSEFLREIRKIQPDGNILEALRAAGLIDQQQTAA